MPDLIKMKINEYGFSVIFSLILFLSSLKSYGEEFIVLVLMNLIVFLLMICYQINKKFKKKFYFPIEKSAVFYAAFTLLCFISLSWSVSHIHSLIEAITFLSGLLALYFSYNLTVNQINIQLEILKIISVLLSVFIVYQALVLHSKEFFGLFTDKNTLATFLVMFLIPISCQYLNNKTSNLSSKSLAFTIFLLVFSISLMASRGAFLALLIDFILLIILFIIHKQKNTFSAISTLLILLVLGFLLAHILSEESVFERILSMKLTDDFGVSEHRGRGGLWIAAWNMFLDKPVLGWGFGTFALLYPQYKPPLNIEAGFL